MSNIVNFEVEKDYSISTSKVSFMPIYTPLNNQQRNTGIIFHKTEDEIKELKVSKIYKKDDLEYRISSIPMDCKTDESILYALLSQNKEEFSIAIKDLAILIGVNKRQATAKNVKERIMNSINKHRTFEFTLLKDGIFHTGFSILSYTFDLPEKDHLTIFFDKQFLNLYRNSNNSIINFKKYLELKSEYAKLIYSLINNFSQQKNDEFTLFPEVIRKRLNNVDENGKTTKITAQQKQKIKQALEELKEKGIIKYSRFNKNDSLVFKLKDNLIKKKTIQEKVLEENLTQLQTKGECKMTKQDRLDELKAIDPQKAGGVLKYQKIKDEIKQLEDEINGVIIKEEVKEILEEKTKEVELTEEDSFFNEDCDIDFNSIMEANRNKEITIIKK